MKTSLRFALISFFAAIASVSATAQSASTESTPRPTRTGMLFTLMDLNRDGALSAEEVAFAPVVLRALDLNEDGNVSAAEAMPPAGTRGQRRVMSTVRVRPSTDVGVLVSLDANGDGELQAFEILNAPVSIRQLDRNGDGVITPNEMVDLVRA